jgi:hypothetical protein
MGYRGECAPLALHEKRCGIKCGVFVIYGLVFVNKILSISGRTAQKAERPLDGR